MASESDLLRKIQALLAKAESTDNEHEAAAFFAKAQAMMLEHAIDEARVREARKAAGEAVSRPVKVDFMYSTNDSNAVGRKQILWAAAKGTRVRFVNYHNTRYGNLQRPGNEGVASQWGALVGYEDDVEACKAMYLSLILQATRFARADWTGGRSRGWSAFLTGYMVGFAGRVQERFVEMQRESVPAESTALVVVVERDVDEAMRGFFPHLVASRRSRIDGIGAQLGRMAGDRADLGQSRVASGVRALKAG